MTGERRAPGSGPAGRRPGREREELGELAERRRRQEAAIDFAQRGLERKALQKLTGLGAAPDTPEVEAKFRSKFPPAPQGQLESARPPAPPANTLTPETVAKALHSFRKSAGPGASGQRADWVKKVVGSRGEQPGAALVTELCNLLADGRAPRGLRQYLGGAEGHALDKEGKERGLDARPACAGKF